MEVPMSDGGKMTFTWSYQDNMNEVEDKKSIGEQKRKKQIRPEDDETMNACGCTCISKPRKQKEKNGEEAEANGEEVKDNGEKSTCGCFSFLHPCKLLGWLLGPIQELRENVSTL